MVQMSAGDIFQAIGGTAGCRKLAEGFYAKVRHNPVLGPLFPGKTMTCAIEAFTAYLVQFLGGPPEDAASRWFLSLRESHVRFGIGARERNAWMKLMVETLKEADIGKEARDALRGWFEHASAYVVNQGRAPAPPAVPAELASEWDLQRALDQTVAAVRRGDAEDAIARAEALGCDPSRRVGVMALMIAAGDVAMLAWVERKVRDDSALISARYYGRTLLHAAAAADRLRLVKTLLELGADPNAIDGGGHTPLYSLGNQCLNGGGDVARVLAAAGADVNWCGGVMRCTPLHMAARRGNVEVARALLECGAEATARDRRGDTALDRAVKCRKSGVATLLASLALPPRSL
jgi:hemoglobin